MNIRTLAMAGASAALCVGSFGLAGAAVAAPGGAHAPCVSTTDFCYDDESDGSMSGNGNGQGSAHKAGSVGKADYKNPPGQVKKNPASDPENGYECDGNSGIARGNPAHSGCTDPSPT